MIIKKESTIEIQEYFNRHNKFYISFMSCLSKGRENMIILENLLKNHDFLKEKEEFREILKFICIISNNHHRSHDFIVTIEQFLLHYSKEMKQSFTNFEIFKIFESNKRILLFFFEHQIINPDELILQSISEKCDTDWIDYAEEAEKSQEFYYKYYFLPEIKNIISEEEIEFISKYTMIDDEIFNKKRHIGENDSKLCEMIQNDSIDEFIQYVNRNNISLSSKIRQSIFETNLFLINNQPTLIEYAAFFGSLQIFNFLRHNKVELTESLWLYVIHSNNAEMIHLLEEHQVKPPDGGFNKCLEEAVKCHHNDIANYILDNLIEYKEKVLINGDVFAENLNSFSFEYRNFLFWPKNLFDNCVFYYLCYHGYFMLVKLYLKYCAFDLNAPIYLPSTILLIFSMTLNGSFNNEIFKYLLNEITLRNLMKL